MIQLGGGPEPRTVSACAEWSAASPPSDDLAALAAIEAMLHMGGFHGRRITLAVPYADLSVRAVNVPASTAGEGVSAEAIFDAQSPATHCWPLVPMRHVSGNGQVTALLVEASAAVLEQWQCTLHRYGAVVEHVHPRPLAALNCLQSFLRRRSDHHRTHVLIDIGLNATGVVVSAGVQPYFIKCIGIGERDLVTAAAKRLDLTREDVRQLRQMVRREELPNAATHASAGCLHADSDPLAWAMFDATRDIAEKLVFEIVMCLKHCQAAYGAPKVETAWLCGEGAEDVSLHHLLMEQAGLIVHVVESLRGLDVSRTSLSTNRRGALAEWATCVGAARLHEGQPQRTADPHDAQEVNA